MILTPFSLGLFSVFSVLHFPSTHGWTFCDDCIADHLILQPGIGIDLNPGYG